jgi:hypothetical protein
MELGAEVVDIELDPAVLVVFASSELAPDLGDKGCDFLVRATLDQGHQGVLVVGRTD